MTQDQWLAQQPCHKGEAQVRQSKDGTIMVLCCVGHLLDTYTPRQWKDSIMAGRVAFGETFTCYGKMPRTA